jgi:predicted nucleotidyltransferase
MEAEAVEALRILARVCSQEGRRFALIGAIVPQVVLDFREGFGSGSRETRDVDAVAEVNSWRLYSLLRAAGTGRIPPGSGGT